MSMRNLQNTWAMSPRTEAANLAANQLNASAQSLALMDKNKTQTTKLRGPDTNVMGDLMPVFGMALGGGMGPFATIGASAGGQIGTAMGGRNAYQSGMMGMQGSGQAWDQTWQPVEAIGSIFGGFMM